MTPIPSPTAPGSATHVANPNSTGVLQQYQAIADIVRGARNSGRRLLTLPMAFGILLRPRKVDRSASSVFVTSVAFSPDRFWTTRAVQTNSLRRSSSKLWLLEPKLRLEGEKRRSFRAIILICGMSAEGQKQKFCGGPRMSALPSTTEVLGRMSEAGVRAEVMSNSRNFRV